MASTLLFQLTDRKGKYAFSESISNHNCHKKTNTENGQKINKYKYTIHNNINKYVKFKA